MIELTYKELKDLIELSSIALDLINSTTDPTVAARSKKLVEQVEQSYTQCVEKLANTHKPGDVLTPLRIKQ